MTQEYDLDKVLLRFLGSEELVKKWWTSPNKAFQDQVPWEVYHGDDHMQVINYILQHTGVDFS